jgi:hypothetical protein
MNAEVYGMEDLCDFFYRHLSRQAFNELQELQMVLRKNPLSDSNDVWTYCWVKKCTSEIF